MKYYNLARCLLKEPDRLLEVFLNKMILIKSEVMSATDENKQEKKRNTFSVTPEAVGKRKYYMLLDQAENFMKCLAPRDLSILERDLGQASGTS